MWIPKKYCHRDAGCHFSAVCPFDRTLCKVDYKKLLSTGTHVHLLICVSNQHVVVGVER
jgi:ABC-type dipeptide/oligopeptide/nickel transport system ATPase component